MKDNGKKLGNSSPGSYTLGFNTSTVSQKAFSKRLVNFLEKTEYHAIGAANPGGYYTGLWCRDSSYILKDWFLSGRTQEVLDQILVIWSHQVDSINDDKIVFGRGSPEMDFKPTIASKQTKERFQGSLPTSIYHERKICEVFGKAPDIDSTALMISTTSWILSRLFAKNASAASSTKSSAHDSLNRIQKILDFTIPRMHKAIEYLTNRDIDNDGLLEQNHNEDWMDSIMRAGKIVYSQACWILALRNFSLLLQLQNKQEGATKQVVKLADTTIKAIEEKLWSEEDGAYIDIQETHHIGGPFRTLTQDVSLYLVALTENTRVDGLSIFNDYHSKKDLLQPQMIKRLDRKENGDKSTYDRLVKTLGSIRTRTWKEKWPLVTEVELVATGPWQLKPYEYHNHTFWPWTTGIEMLARSRFGQLKECDILLSTLASEGHPHVHCYYEWLNPISDTSGGVYPFRTGISAVRIAISDILTKIGSPYHSSQGIQQSKARKR
ncbi:MAG: GH116 family glycosyl hydrolase [Thermoproteota archaeon]|nr:GH116 family glycosyl hydrolase [Thermoproteota archaeon]